jgi:hypothetical protein
MRSRVWTVAAILVLLSATDWMVVGASETSGVLILCEANNGRLSLVDSVPECAGTAYEIEGQLAVAPSATATATNTPVPPTATSTAVPPTATSVPPTATPTVDPGGNFGACGEHNDRWHPAVINQAYVDKWGVGVVGCQTGHHHGDPAPQWAIDWLIGHGEQGYVLYGGPSQTPNENELKHQGYVGVGGSLVGNNGEVQQYYIVFHAQTNPAGRSGGAWSGRIHSKQVFQLDDQGGVTRVQKWENYGATPQDRSCIDDAIGLAAGCTDRNGTGEMIVAIEGQTACESWYNNASTNTFGPEGGLFICNVMVWFDYDERDYASFDAVAQWPVRNGATGNSIGMDFNWYEFEGGPHRGTTFWTTQIGTPVSGPNDPLCSGQQTVFGVVVDVVCVEQNFSPTWTGVEFPNNVIFNHSVNATGVSVGSLLNWQN